MELASQTFTQTFNRFTLLDKSSRRGFTLIELIVVMTIIATLLALGVGTIKNVAGAKGVSTGVSIAEGVFNHARTLAKAKGEARVFIYAESDWSKKEQMREKYLRYMVVGTPVLKPKNDPADADEYEWKTVGGGISLPRDIFFNKKLCVGVQKDKVAFPGSSVKKDCYYYEFNSEGALVSPTGDARFIIQAGKLIPGQTKPKVPPNRKRDVGGFRIWSTGRISVYRSPNQIKSDDIEF